jgi:protein O-mannosyl-transferase
LKASRQRRNGRPTAVESEPVKSHNNQLRQIPAILLAAITFSLVTFAPALEGTFVFDDFHLPFADPNAAQMPARFWLGGVRPLLMLTYWANFLFSGRNTFSYHLLNLLLHAFAGVLVYFVLQQLCKLEGVENGNWLSFFGAGVFLLHPLQTESVDYIAGRSEVLCAVFILGGWLIFLQHFRNRISLPVSIAILLFGVGAILSKESGVCFFVILLATDLYWRRGTIVDTLRKRWPLYSVAAVGGVAACALILLQLRRSVTAGFSSGAGPWEYLLTECRAIVIYLRLFIYPAGQNLDWRLPFYHSIRDDGAGLFVMLVLALGVAIIYLARNARLASFGLLFFLIALAPTSSFVPLQDALAERRMYLSLVGLILVVTQIVIRLGCFESASRFIMAAILLTLAIASHARSELWISDIEIWRDSLAKNPSNSRGHTWLAGAFMLRQNCAAAAREYKSTVDIEGLNAENGRNLAVAYDCAGQREEALKEWQALLRVHPSAEAYDRTGYLFAMQNKVAESLAAFDAALRLDPADANAYALRGTARMALRDPARASEDFNRALSLQPGNAIAAAGIAKMPNYH